MASYPDQALSNLMASHTDIVAVQDNEEKRISAFYLFDRWGKEATRDIIVFDPKNKKTRSLGRYATLVTEEWMKEEGITHVYIGPVNTSHKLAHKTMENPEAIEAYVDGKWVPYDPEKHTQGPDYRTALSNMGYNLD